MPKEGSGGGGGSAKEGGGMEFLSLYFVKVLLNVVVQIAVAAVAAAGSCWRLLLLFFLFCRYCNKLLRLNMCFCNCGQRRVPAPAPRGRSRKDLLPRPRKRMGPERDRRQKSQMEKEGPRRRRRNRRGKGRRRIPRGKERRIPRGILPRRATLLPLLLPLPKGLWTLMASPEEKAKAPPAPLRTLTPPSRGAGRTIWQPQTQSKKTKRIKIAYGTCTFRGTEQPWSPPPPFTASTGTPFSINYSKLTGYMGTWTPGGDGHFLHKEFTGKATTTAPKKGGGAEGKEGSGEKNDFDFSPIL